jgi:hypothetical protein
MRRSKEMNPLDSQRERPPSDYIGYKSAEFKSIEHHPSARGFSSTPFNLVIPVPKGVPAPVSSTTKRSESVAAKLQQMMKLKN